MLIVETIAKCIVTVDRDSAARILHGKMFDTGDVSVYTVYKVAM